jgi:hypothetical protein
MSADKPFYPSQLESFGAQPRCPSGMLIRKRNVIRVLSNPLLELTGSDIIRCAGKLVLELEESSW